MIVGGWKPIPATHIHDELYARCLLLDDGTVKLGKHVHCQKPLTYSVYESLSAGPESLPRAFATGTPLTSTGTPSGVWGQQQICAAAPLALGSETLYTGRSREMKQLIRPAAKSRISQESM
jgi:hypothetical protein